jgi:opacity protein-like surface antigen
MRVLLLVAALGASALLAATAAAAVDPKAPQQRHTVADTRLADSLALRRADLGSGWKVDTRNPGNTACAAEPNESKLVQTAKVDPSFVWQDGVTTLGSEVDVYKTAAMAREDWGLSTLRLERACLIEAATSDLGGHGRVTLDSATKLPSPGLAERSLHYRLVITLHSTKTVKFVTDLVALGHGRVIVVLQALSLAKPLPAAGIEALTAKLAGRLAGGSGIGA